MEAVAIRDALREIADKNGRTTAEIVVEAARRPDHPLHDVFEWDDGIAGQQYRIIQARMLMRVHMTREIDGEEISVPIMVRDPSVGSGEQGYRMFENLARDLEDARTAVAAEFVRAASHLKRARDVATGLGYRDQIDRLLKQMMRLGRRIEREPDSPSPGA